MKKSSNTCNKRVVVNSNGDIDDKNNSTGQIALLALEEPFYMLFGKWHFVVCPRVEKLNTANQIVIKPRRGVGCGLIGLWSIFIGNLYFDTFCFDLANFNISCSYTNLYPTCQSRISHVSKISLFAGKGSVILKAFSPYFISTFLISFLP